MQQAIKTKHRNAELPPAVAAFRFFLLNAAPGERFTYHTGFLMNDRAVPDVSATPADPDPVARIKAQAEREGRDDPWFPMQRIREVDLVAREVWAAHEAREVVLLQRRIGPSTWSYIAQKRGRVPTAFDVVG